MKYEVTLMLKPSLSEDQVKKVITDVKSAVTGAGAKVENEEESSKKKLAYEIRNLQDAYFYSFEVESDKTFTKKITSKLNVQTEVLRFMVEGK